MLATLLMLVAVSTPAEGTHCPATDGKGEWTWTNESGGYWWRYKRQAEETPIEALNRRRARLGLRLVREDKLLSRCAKACAEYRAARRIAGHTPNDFQFLTDGARSNEAGCAAWPVSMGWGSCLADDPNMSVVGVGWAMGSDGLRYMQLFKGR